MSNPEEPIFYAYLILDPRHQGTFIYDGGKLILPNLPIYGGKGCNGRCDDHNRDAKNTTKQSDKLDLLREILDEGFEPIIIKIIEGVIEKEALGKEKELIWVIGRADMNTGTLTNKTWGGEGGHGRIIENLTGKIFGRLTVKEFSKTDISGHSKWLCVCKCGDEKIIQSIHLKSGQTQSCGCLRNENITKVIETHGMSRTSYYSVYHNMVQKHKGKICDRWLESFENFLEEVGERPSDRHMLCRINNNGIYEISNCKWMIKEERYNNKKNNILLTINNKTHTLKEWSNISGANYSTMKDRHRNRWCAEEIIYGKV